MEEIFLPPGVKYDITVTDKGVTIQIPRKYIKLSKEFVQEQKLNKADRCYIYEFEGISLIRENEVHDILSKYGDVLVKELFRNRFECTFEDPRAAEHASELDRKKVFSLIIWIYCCNKSH
jgi:hypothetical protein